MMCYFFPADVRQNAMPLLNIVFVLREEKKQESGRERNVRTPTNLFDKRHISAMRRS